MREQRDIDGPFEEVLRRGVVRGEAARGRRSPAALSARCAPIRPARRSEAARTSGSARSAHTKFSVSAGTIDGGDPSRAQEVVRGRYGSCPPRRQGSAPAPCRRQIGCSLKTAGRVLLRIYSPGPDRSAFSVLAADTHEVDDFYIGAKAPGKSGALRCF